MAKTTKKQLRAAWLQVHKWIGLSLAILIIPISLTGAALVWHDWLEAKLEPQRHQTIGPAALPASAYAAAARSVLAEDERITTLRFDADGGPVAVTASKRAPAGGGRPERPTSGSTPAMRVSSTRLRRAAGWCRSCTCSTAA